MPKNSRNASVGKAIGEIPSDLKKAMFAIGGLFALIMPAGAIDGRTEGVPSTSAAPTTTSTTNPLTTVTTIIRNFTTTITSTSTSTTSTTSTSGLFTTPNATDVSGAFNCTFNNVTDIISSETFNVYLKANNLTETFWNAANQTLSNVTQHIGGNMTNLIHYVNQIAANSSDAAYKIVKAFNDMCFENENPNNPGGNNAAIPIAPIVGSLIGAAVLIGVAIYAVNRKKGSFQPQQVQIQRNGAQTTRYHVNAGEVSELEDFGEHGDDVSASADSRGIGAIRGREDPHAETVIDVDDDSLPRAARPAADPRGPIKADNLTLGQRIRAFFSRD